MTYSEYLNKYRYPDTLCSYAQYVQSFDANAKHMKLKNLNNYVKVTFLSRFMDASI